MSSYSLLQNAFAVSPAFDPDWISDKEISNQRNDWVQIYGNDSTHLRSGYANILAVNYLSDGKTLDATFWLASSLENDSTYNQPLKRIRYGMLITVASLPSTSGYNGANYNYYIEAVDGKWSEYLYQLSSTGSSALIESKINYTEPFAGNATMGPGYVKLRLDLKSINYPTEYGLLFYTAESFKSNEVRDFTGWIAIPPATIDILTQPDKIVLKKGEKDLVSAEINTPFSNNITSITFDNNSTDFNSYGLHVSTRRIQPLEFEVEVSPQTPVGVYTVPLAASVLIQTTSLTSSMVSDSVIGSVDPEYQASKKYPTTGYVTGPANLTINVIPALSLGEEISAIWTANTTTVNIVLGTVTGALLTFFINRMQSRKEQK